MKKTKTRRDDPVEQAMRRLRAVEQGALAVRAVLRMPTGTPALDAAQDAAMAAVDRALAGLKSQYGRGPR